MKVLKLQLQLKNTLGKICKDSTREKIAAGQRGRKATQEAKDNMRNAKLGVKQSPSHIANRTKKLAEIFKDGVGPNSGIFGKHPNIKPILQFDLDNNFVKRWESSNEIYRETGFNHRNIRMCCSGQRNKAHNFIWKFEIVQIYNKRKINF